MSPALAFYYAFLSRESSTLIVLSWRRLTTTVGSSYYPHFLCRSDSQYILVKILVKKSTKNPSTTTPYQSYGGIASCMLMDLC